MTRYDTSVDMTNRNTSHTLVAELVGEGRTVLDVGCATGYLAQALTAQGCTVSGVELDPEAAELARPRLHELRVADVEGFSFAEAFPGGSFDAIVLADVLEHLKDPAAVLRSALEVLAENGAMVISVPNVAHGSLRLALLEGRWRTTDTGLLDRTHLQFFTLESLVQLLGDAGLVVQEAWSTTIDPLRTEVRIDADALPEGVVEWVRHQPHALVYQYVVRVTRGEATGALPEVLTPARAEEIRLDDEHAARARELAEEKHRAMIMRDHVIGLEAQLARVQRDLARLERSLGEVAADRAAVYRSASWRAGRVVTAPVRMLKRVAR